MKPAAFLGPKTALLAVLTSLSCAVGAHAQEIKVGGTGAALGTVRILAEAYSRQQAGVALKTLPSMGSGGGINAVIAGAIDIGVSARPLKESERKAGATEIEYGRTPFVFATPVSVQASALTTQELVGIYGGTLETWPEGSRIRLVLRPLGDSDSETIKSISPALRDAKTAAEQRKGMLFTVTDQDTADSLERTPGALGPSTLALIMSEKRALKALAFNGVTPSASSIANGSYPLYKQMFLVTGPKVSAAAQGFITFVRSPAGRDILAQYGHWVKQ